MCIGQVKGGIYGVPFGLTKVFKSPGGGYLLFSFVLVPFTLFGLVDMCRYPCIVFVFVERSLLCWFLCFFESSLVVINKYVLTSYKKNIIYTSDDL